MKKHEDESLDLEGLIKELELKLERLKVVYEQYFMGIERREPLVLKKDVVRLMRALDQVKIRNTGLKFRFRMLMQRFNSYKTYWGRTIRAIENGTYHRDVARVSRKMARQGIIMPSKGKLRTAAEVERAITQAMSQARAEENVEGSGAQEGVPAGSAAAVPPDKAALAARRKEDLRGRPEEPEPLAPINIDQQDEAPSASPQSPAASPQSPAASARTPAASPPPPPPRPRPQVGTPPPSPSSRPYPSTDPLSDEQMKSIYRRFIKAKRMCGEDTGSIHYETLAKSLSQQLPKIQAQHKGKRVEFQVVIRAGRAIIRAQGKE